MIKKHLLLLILGISFSTILYAQNNFEDRAELAVKLYNEGAYYKAGIALQKLYTDYPVNPLFSGYSYYINTEVWAWAKANETDKAFDILFELSEEYNKYDYELEYNSLIEDEELKSLHNDPRWLELTEKVKPMYLKMIPFWLNLHNFYSEENSLMIDYFASINEKGGESKEAVNIANEYKQLIASNYKETTDFIDSNGFPSLETTTWEAHSSLFSIFNNADMEDLNKYLPIIKDAYADFVNYDKEKLAYLEDQFVMFQGKKQIYGTYIYQDETGEIVVYPMESPEKVNERRKEYGIRSIESFLNEKGVYWDIEKHKKLIEKFDLEKKNK